MDRAAWMGGGALVLLLALGGAGWWWLQIEEAPPPALRSPGSDARSGSIEEQSGGDGSGPVSLEPERRRQPAAEAEPVPDPRDGRGLRVQVLDGETRRPVPGAELWWLALASASREVQLLAHERPEDVALVSQHGQRVALDDEGRVRLPQRPGWICLFARHEGRSAWSRCWNPGGRDEVLFLRPRRELVVRTREPGGRAIPGIPVLWLHYEHSALMSSLPRAEVSDRRVSEGPEAEARFLHLPDLVNVSQGVRYGVERGWFVALECPGLETFTAEPVDLRDVEDVVLEVPAFGSLEVELFDAEGQPFLEPATLRFESGADSWMQVRGTRSVQPPSLQRRSVDGRVLWPCVGTERDLELLASVAGFADRRVQLPRLEEGEHRRVRVQFEAPHPAIVGRACDGDGTPLRDRSLLWKLARASSSFASWGRWVQTDESGGFRIAVDPSAEERALWLGRVSHSSLQFSGCRGVLRCEIPPLREGEHDLGELRIEDRPLMARGRVLDGSGLPIAGAVVAARTEAPSPRAFAETASDVQGAFELFGEHERWDGQLSVRADGHGVLVDGAWREEAVVDVQPGVPVELRMQALGVVRGPCRRSPWLDPTHVLARFDPEDPSLHFELMDGVWELRGRPGPVSMSVCVVPSTHDPWTDFDEIDAAVPVEHFELELPEGPRSGEGPELDLRRMWTHVVRVLDENGGPLARPFVELPGGAVVTGNLRGDVVVSLAQPPPRLRVGAPGKRTAEFACAGARSEVRLGPGLPVELCFEGPEAGEVWLRNGGAPALSAERSGPQRYLLHAPGPGEYPLVVSLAGDRRNLQRVIHVEERADRQRVEVDLHPRPGEED